jgi:hypothetical protein
MLQPALFLCLQVTITKSILVNNKAKTTGGAVSIVYGKVSQSG